MQEVEKMLIENWIINVLSGYKLENNENLRERVFECVKKIYSKIETLEGEIVNINVLKLALEVLTYRDIKENKTKESIEIFAYSLINEDTIKVILEGKESDNLTVRSYEFI